jgi:adenylate cyclase
MDRPADVQRAVTAPVAHAPDAEAQIFADSALRGERVVSGLRIFTWMLLGIANAGVGAASGERQETSLVRGAVVFGWLVFAIAVAVLIRRVRFTPSRAVWWPLAFMVVDFGVTTFLNLVTNRGVHPEIPGAIFLILVGFSVARFSAFHVWASAGLASVAIVSLASLLPGFNWRGVAVMVAAREK